jgi:hypothetical protein
MNPRQHKKQAKRAMRALIRDHGYRSDNFDPVRQRDDVTIDAPWDMDDRFVEARDRAKAWSGYFCPLPGTPILWDQDYWTSDADPHCPIHVLAECELWANADPDELANLAAT